MTTDGSKSRSYRHPLKRCRGTRLSPLVWLLSLDLSHHLFWLSSLAALPHGSAALLFFPPCGRQGHLTRLPLISSSWVSTLLGRRCPSCLSNASRPPASPLAIQSLIIPFFPKNFLSPSTTLPISEPQYAFLFVPTPFV